MTPDLDSKLGSLKKYARDQTRGIECLNIPYYFQVSDDIVWNDLWSSVWNSKTDEIRDKDHTVERSPDPDAIDNALILPDVVPLTCRVMTYPEASSRCWTFDTKQIYIRSVYNDAEAFALSKCQSPHEKVLIFTGQSGIGKSVFLFRLLLCRLKHGLPTALQVNKDSALLFYEGGVMEFSRPNGSTPYTDLTSTVGPAGRIWALVDVNEGLQRPGSIFRDGTFFVVQTSFPHPENRGWMSKISHRVFYMKPWSLSEVIQVRSLVKPHLSERELFEMHNGFAPSLRSVLSFVKNVGAYKTQVYAGLNGIPPTKVESALRNPLNYATIRGVRATLTGTTMLNPIHLLPEILDSIVDFLHNNPVTLKRCCLVSKSWVPRTRKHIFEEVEFRSGSSLAAWKRTFPEPAKSPAHYTRSLIVYCTGAVTTEDAEDGSWIQSFTNVSRMEIEADRSEPGLKAFTNLPSAIKSLHVCVAPPALPLSKFFDLVCSFPSLEDLMISGSSSFIDDMGEGGAIFQPSTLPLLTGTLVFFSTHPETVTRRLMDLPGGLHFHKIKWQGYFSEGEFESISALVESCSDTLECIEVAYPFFPDESPEIKVDLSISPKLREVAFHIGLNIAWVIAAIETITSEHRNLQQISLIFNPVYCRDAELSALLEEADFPRWMALECNLVSLCESRAIHLKIVWHGEEGAMLLPKLIEHLLPEVTGRRLVDIVVLKDIRRCGW